MLNFASLLTGLFALLFVIPGLIPLLGWMNWLALPIAIVGFVIGLLSSKTAGRNVNLVVILLALVRGSMFGGVI